MSHTRHRLAALSGALVVCALLSGCFGGDDTQPSAAHSTRHHHGPGSTTPTDTPTSDATSAPSSAPPVTSALRFSPKSGGKHLDDCQLLVPGDDPAEFLYYPVVVTPDSAVTLDSVATDHTQGVVDSSAWVAPTGPTPETGTFKGWPPPKIVTGDSNLQWSKRVSASGAALEAGTSYNVFLHLQVDPTPGDSKVNGIAFSYHDASGTHTDTWVAHTTFSMSC
jgi:hypothetical protein